MAALAALLCDAADPDGPPALARVVAAMEFRGPCASWIGGGPGMAVAADALLVGEADLLRAYAERGDGMVDRLRGEFAFAIWDGLRRRILCARDPSGARPLYWLSSGGRFACASSARALRALGWIPAPVRESRVADALVDLLELSGPDESMFEGIHRLPAGHFLVVEEGRVSVRPAGTLAPAPGVPFVDAFRRAVGARLGGAAGAMLSGGIDSSSIAVVGRDLLRAGGHGPLRTFSALSAEGEPCVEGPFVREVLATGGFEPLVVRPADLPRLAPRLAEAEARFEEPFDAMCGAVPLLMFAAAREAGLDALLDGVDGNLATSLDLECIGHAAAGGRWRLARSLARGFGRTYGVSGARLFARLALLPAAPAPVRRAWRAIRPAGVRADPLEGSPIAAAFAIATGTAGRVEQVLSEVYADEGRGDAAARARSLRRAGGAWLTTAVERYGRASAAWGVEARHPFGDRDLLEACLAIPWEERVSGGRPKALLRDFLAGAGLPGLAARRPAASNLNPLFEAALLRVEGDGLRDRVEAEISLLGERVDGARVRTDLASFLLGGEPGTVPSAMRVGGWLRAIR